MYQTKYKVIYKIRGNTEFESPLYFNKWHDANGFCKDIKYYAIHARIYKVKLWHDEEPIAYDIPVKPVNPVQLEISFKTVMV